MPEPERPPRRARRFSYDGLDIRGDTGELLCRYLSDGESFVERIILPGTAGSACWERPDAQLAARWVHLLAGVSYYKTGAASVIDLGDTPITESGRGFLRHFYVDGLGEFAFRNGLDLGDIEVIGGSAPVAPASPLIPASRSGSASRSGPLRPLIPFGGGIDSIVTTELVRRIPGADPSLFIVGRPQDRYAAIEGAASVSALPIVRAERSIDDKVLRSGELGYWNGHVPVTGIVSAIAVLAAVLGERDAVIMSNEASASVPNFVVHGRGINHQWSKGASFEEGFRSVLAGQGCGIEYFSLLRPASELWVANQFAALRQYHHMFRSCNRAFYVDPARRLDHWCGECDKCCFVDLILAPFMSKAGLEAVFDMNEPLANDALAERFKILLGTSPEPKPFDCVGDISECRSALRLAACRPDRARDRLLHDLLAGLPADMAGAGVGRLDASSLNGPHFIPDAYAPRDLLV